jgi:hypothetical protein
MDMRLANHNSCQYVALATVNAVSCFQQDGRWAIMPSRQASPIQMRIQLSDAMSPSPLPGHNGSISVHILAHSGCLAAFK